MLHEEIILKLKPILILKIEEAINETVDKLASGNKSFPWLGENCYHILADSVITVLKGMQDTQDYIEKEKMLK